MTTGKYPAALLAQVDVGGEMAGFPTAILSGAHNISVATITLTATVPATWPTAGWVTVDTEIIQYAAKSGATLTGCTRGAQSTYGGSVAATHADQAIVGPYLTPQAWNQVVADIIATQTKVGYAAGTPTTVGQVLTVTAAGQSAWAAASAGANNITTPHVFDDFTHGLTSSGTVSPIGSLNWQVVRSAGNIIAAAAVANHPGIGTIDTSAVGSSYFGLYGQGGASSQFSVLPADNFDITFIVRPGATVDAQMEFLFGFIDAMLTTSGTNAANGIYVEKRGADTSYFGVVRGASAQTRTAASGTVTASTWVKFRIRRVNGTTIGFTQDANAEVNVTTNIPTVAMTPFIHVSNATAVSRTLDIDLFDLTITGITR